MATLKSKKKVNTGTDRNAQRETIAADGNSTVGSTTEDEPSEAVTGFSRDVIPVETALTRLFGSLQVRYDDPYRNEFSTGYRELDALTAGLHAEDLIVIGGRPMSGKTALALGVAQHVGIKCRNGVAFFSPESTSTQLATRLIASLGWVAMSAIRSGHIEDDDHWARVAASIKLLKQARMWVDDTPGLTPDQMHEKVFQLQKNHGELSLVVVDNLQQMRVPGLRSNRTAEVTEVVRSLKELAKEARVPVVATSHLIRPTERSWNNGRPVLTDLRDSGAIEDVADAVLLLHRPETELGAVEVILAKQKHGACGSFKLRFREEFSLMESIQTVEDFATAERLSAEERDALRAGLATSRKAV
ncbi:DnaB-like helicase C-terminal domain-containing protein [Xanthomonas translucens pv. undulosa]|uniref:DnaB-like helicase C-terminal domain-containing protein n=1 Tax=Xanthomonas campestris pv. translucens TaxID=343 RepID=UPI003CFA36F9